MQQNDNDGSSDHQNREPILHHGRPEEEPIPSLSQSVSFADIASLAGTFIERKAEDARPLLPKAAFFMGDLRDGLPMVRARK